MLSLKTNCRIKDLSPQAMLGITICSSVYAAHDYDCVVTSINDSRHMTNSLHYRGYAFDLRIWMIPEEMRESFAAELAAALGPEFDVVLEDDHIHVEADFQGLAK